MNEFTNKKDQAFLDTCGAMNVKPNALFNTQKERCLVSESLKHPASWLETEMLYHSYATWGEAQAAPSNWQHYLFDISSGFAGC
jgi:hypothetical protein